MAEQEHDQSKVREDFWRSEVWVLERQEQPETDQHKERVSNLWGGGWGLDSLPW